MDEGEVWVGAGVGVGRCVHGEIPEEVKGDADLDRQAPELVEAGHRVPDALRVTGGPMPTLRSP